MSNLFHKCVCGKCKNESHKIFATAVENNRKLTVFNNDSSMIMIVKVDGCYYPRGKGPSKCDYLFSFEKTECNGEIKKNHSKLLFVELKGSKGKGACDQIKSAIQNLEAVFNCSSKKKEAIIVAKSCPAAHDSSTIKEIAEMRSKFQTAVTFRTGQYEYQHSF